MDDAREMGGRRAADSIRRSGSLGPCSCDEASDSSNNSAMIISKMPVDDLTRLLTRSCLLSDVLIIQLAGAAPWLLHHA